MPSLKQIIDALDTIEGGMRGSIPESWLQGRTSYGGLSAALALHVAQQSDVDLPPLRSALIAFIGPLAGDITIRTNRLRRGRNAAFIQADVECNAGLGLRATFVFMNAIASTVDYQVGGRPDFPPPGPEDATFKGNSAVAFAQNFELLDRRDSAVGPTEWLRWVRLNERGGLDPMVELMAIADCLPPAALKLVGAPAPCSSMTWQINLLGNQPTTIDGWWLLRTSTNYARGGSSSQEMMIWNLTGEPIAEQMQSVAIFG